MTTIAVEYEFMHNLHQERFGSVASQCRYQRNKKGTFLSEAILKDFDRIGEDDHP